MNKIIAFNTSYGTYNLGDFIISESIQREMKDIFSKCFVVNLPTHNPVYHFYQLNKKHGGYRFLLDYKYKFIFGTNIIKKSMLNPFCDWNVNIFNCAPYKNSILIGVGCGGTFEKVNLYTRILYKKILSKDYIHSVRDERTKRFLESMGFKAINTGCATLWALTPEKCKQIPIHKSDTVIFTLTDYMKDIKNDQKMIDILKKNYKKVYYWVQGVGDEEYFNEFNNTDDISIIYQLDDFRELLKNGNIDYVGTRLHGGIFSMQNNVRTIIISVDNRAEDMRKSYSIPCIERKKIENLEGMINSDFETKINMDYDRINAWKSQFRV